MANVQYSHHSANVGWVAFSRLAVSLCRDEFRCVKFVLYEDKAILVTRNNNVLSQFQTVAAFDIINVGPIVQGIAKCPKFLIA